jgi:hypothetical protein
MIGLIILAVILGLLLVAVFGGYVYESGQEAGRREQQRMVNRAADELRRQGVDAQRRIDYLYEQAQSRIYDSDGRSS